MGNNAVEVNSYSPSAPQDLTDHGSSFLWAIFSLMMVSNLVVSCDSHPLFLSSMPLLTIQVFVWHLTIPRGQRVFHQIGLIILTTASIAYFTLASNYGKAIVPTEYAGANGFPAGTGRSIWYVRYIDWAITTPALLMELCLATGLPLSDVITLIFFDIVMIVTGLVGALIPTAYKWAFWAFGMAALFYIWWVLAGPARESARALGGHFSRSFVISGSLLSILWLVYPIIWGVADGGNVITTDSEMVAYGVLDFLAKPVFLFIHLWFLSKEDLSRLQLSSGKFSTTADAIKYDREKNAFVGGNNGVNAAGSSAPVAAGGKRGMFGRKGRYDAEPVAATGEGAPRPSEATAVSAH